MQRFVIPARLPGLNELIEQRARSPHLYRKTKERYGGIVALAARGAGLKPFVSPVAFAFHFMERDRRRDPDNIASAAMKICLDALQELGVLPGDGWKWVTGISLTWGVSKTPGVVVTMRSE